VSSNAAINYGITTFDNLGTSILTIFQVITLEGWVSIMYNLQDAVSTWGAALYFVALVMIGSFFLLNMILAVIMNEFQKVDDNQKRERALEEQRIKEQLIATKTRDF